MTIVTGDEEIDQLYQVPLREFTSARNALARRAGDRAPGIRQLEKPSAAAWGVNQLYWRNRETFDRLMATFEQVRNAQARLLTGKGADLPKAEAAYRRVLNRAADDVRNLLQADGDAASSATMTSVRETLEALPFSAFDGRLSRPLAPAGFGALAGLMGKLPDRPVRSAEVVSIEKGRRRERVPDSEAAERRRRAEQRRAAIAGAEAELTSARRAESAADTKLSRATAEATRARRLRERLREELEEAEAEAKRTAGAADLAADEARAATAAREQAEKELQRLRSEG